MSSRSWILVSAIVCLFALQITPALAQYDNWNFYIRAQGAAITDSLAMIGVRPDASADFENQYDIPRPPRAPSGNYLEVYFPHSGGNYPPVLGTKYAVDMQGPADPVWFMSVESSVPGTVTLSWDSTYVGALESRVQLFLYDSAGSMSVNMRTRGSYTFMYATKRNFRIVGAVKIDLRYLMEGFWNGTTQVGDTVQALLASGLPPYDTIDSTTVVLSATGTARAIFTNATSDAYYVIVRHLNHLEIWSALSHPCIKGTTSFSSYDFSAGPTTAFGIQALKQEGSVYVAWGGDVDRNGVIDYRDRNITHNNRGLAGRGPTDCNGDGATDGSDYMIVLNNRLRTSQRP